MNRENPQIFPVLKFKIVFSSIDAQSSAARI